ncbi:hypothetical protein KY337_05255 [Candidatus Woesearchaeota archaeon]|nr:hypothetical protein [Candidatus Woesearchaeota archaeon]
MHSNEQTKQRIKETYAESSRAITGIVVDDWYFSGRPLLRQPERSGLFSYSNETVRLGVSKYVIKLRRDDNKKVIALSIIDNNDGQKEALDSLVSSGSRISFPRGNYFDPGKVTKLKHPSWAEFAFGTFPDEEYAIYRDPAQTYFRHNTQIGVKRAELISILDK